MEGVTSSATGENGKQQGEDVLNEERPIFRRNLERKQLHSIAAAAGGEPLTQWQGKGKSRPPY